MQDPDILFEQLKRMSKTMAKITRKSSNNNPVSTRSYNMSCIRSKDTKPEEIVRKYLFSRGLRYRKNDKRYTGKPDIVISKYRTIVFVHGCFWHAHHGCPGFKMPETNADYWKPKLERNQQRDTANIEALCSSGWRVIVIWECELKKVTREGRLSRLYDEITLGNAIKESAGEGGK